MQVGSDLSERLGRARTGEVLNSSLRRLFFGPLKDRLQDVADLKALSAGRGPRLPTRLDDDGKSSSVSGWATPNSVGSTGER